MLEKIKDWKVIYPIYFDKKVSRAKGRKVSEKLAIDTPDCDDFQKILKHLHIDHVLEVNKRHPRDPFCDGRIRYCLKREDNTFCNEEIKNSKKYLLILEFALYEKLGELIPKLKDRKPKYRSDIVTFSMPTLPGNIGGKKMKNIKQKKRKMRR